MSSASLCWVLLSVCLLLVSAEQKNITAESGQKVTLTCQTPNNNRSIIAVQWRRADLQPEYVLFYRDEQLVPQDQHPSFKNRVDLQDRQMKDGDVSLVLKDVTTADTGTYECRVAQREPNQDRADLRPIINITLSVVAPPGQRGGTSEDGGKEDGAPVGLIVGLSVSALLLVGSVGGFVLYRKHQQAQSQDPYLPHDEPQPA